MRSATLETLEATYSDPARFAEAVRAVARDAYRVRRAPSPAAVRGLSRRIEALAAALGDRRGGPLGSWLDNLGREVRSAPVRRDGSARPACGCA